MFDESSLRTKNENFGESIHETSLAYTNKKEWSCRC